MNHSVDRARITLPLGVSRGTAYTQCVCVCMYVINIQQLYLSFLSARHSSFAERECSPIELFANRCEPAIPFSINSAEELRINTMGRRYRRLRRDSVLSLQLVPIIINSCSEERAQGSARGRVTGSRGHCRGSMTEGHDRHE